MLLKMLGNKHSQRTANIMDSGKLMLESNLKEIAQELGIDLTKQTKETNRNDRENDDMEK